MTQYEWLRLRIVRVKQTELNHDQQQTWESCLSCERLYFTLLVQQVPLVFIEVDKEMLLQTHIFLYFGGADIHLIY